MKLIISNVSGVPIYEQIKQQIKAAILSGELQAEETLPSLRTLAKDLKISVLTVTKAYTELEQEGFVKNVQGRGCFVMGSGSELIKEQLICKVENNLTEAIKSTRSTASSSDMIKRVIVGSVKVTGLPLRICSIHRGITSPFGHFNGGKNR